MENDETTASAVQVVIEDVLPKPEAVKAAPVGLTRDAVFAKAKEHAISLVQKHVREEGYGYAELPHRVAVRAMLAESKKLCGK